MVGSCPDFGSFGICFRSLRVEHVTRHGVVALSQPVTNILNIRMALQVAEYVSEPSKCICCVKGFAGISPQLIDPYLIMISQYLFKYSLGLYTNGNVEILMNKTYNVELEKVRIGFIVDIFLVYNHIYARIQRLDSRSGRHCSLRYIYVSVKR